MPKIVYAGPHRAVVVNGVLCEFGEEVAFPAPVVASLLEQDAWTRAGRKPRDPDDPLGVVDYDALEPDAAEPEPEPELRLEEPEPVTEPPAAPAEGNQS